MLEQARATAAKNAPVFKFGVQVPQHEHEARKLEMNQGHTRWTDAETTEQECLHDCDAFEDCGKGADAPTATRRSEFAMSMMSNMIYDTVQGL